MPSALHFIIFQSTPDWNIPTWRPDFIIKRHFRPKRPFLPNFTFFQIFIPDMPPHIIWIPAIPCLLRNPYPAHAVYVPHPEHAAHLPVRDRVDPVFYRLHLLLPALQDLAPALIQRPVKSYYALGRPPRGDVDWNSMAIDKDAAVGVVSLAETWIEIPASESVPPRRIMSSPSRRRGLKSLWICFFGDRLSRLPRGDVD